MTDPANEPALSLNPLLRVMPSGGSHGADGNLVELDDCNGRTMRMVLSAEAIGLLERFREGHTLSNFRSEMLAAGTGSDRVDLMLKFLSGPCRDKRILIAEGESLDAHELPAKPAYLNVMIELFSPRLVNPLASLLQWSFAPPALWLGGALIVAAMASMFHAMRSQLLAPALSAGEILGVGAIAMFGILLHEFGHAAAAYRLGARRVSIGVGWYLVIPVAYSELSELWRYPRRSRVVVDLAGVYMQGLILAALMLLFHTQQQVIWLVAAGTTATSMLWNLNPFLRMDGYWIVADALGVNDLRERAATQLVQAIRRLLARQRPLDERASSSLVVYAALSAIFLGWLLIRAVMFLVDTLRVSLPDALARMQVFSWSSLSAAELTLAVLAGAWHLLLLYISLRFVATAPLRLRTWWGSDASSTAPVPARESR